MIAGVCVGVVAGVIYYNLIGCKSGTCPITSSPLWSIIFGGIMGGLLFGLFKATPKER